MSEGRYSARKNNSGPGWYVIDSTTGREVAWVFDQALGHKHPEEDERRSKLFAAALNGDKH